MNVNQVGYEQRLAVIKKVLDGYGLKVINAIRQNVSIADPFLKGRDCYTRCFFIAVSLAL